MTTVLSTIPSTPATPPAAEAPVDASEPASEAPAAGLETPLAAVSAEVAPQTPADESKEPKEDPDVQLAQKFEQITRREARVRKLESQLQTRIQSFDEKEKTIAAKMAEIEAFFEDPISWAKKNNRDAMEIVKRATIPMSEEEKRLAKIEAEFAKDREERQKRETEAEKRAREAEERRGWASFVAEITPDEYPHLTAVHEAHEIPKLVMTLLNRPQDPTDPESPSVREVFRAQYRRDPTPKEIRDALEAEAELRATSLLERLTPKKTATSQATPETPAAKPESPSLSNQHAASSTSARVGTETREERLRRLKEELEAEASATE